MVLHALERVKSPNRTANQSLSAAIKELHSHRASLSKSHPREIRFPVPIGVNPDSCPERAKHREAHKAIAVFFYRDLYRLSININRRSMEPLRSVCRSSFWPKPGCVGATSRRYEESRRISFSGSGGWYKGRMRVPHELVFEESESSRTAGCQVPLAP